jgi:hypothetical protein
MTASVLFEMDCAVSDAGAQIGLVVMAGLVPAIHVLSG